MDLKKTRCLLQGLTPLKKQTPVCIAIQRFRLSALIGCIAVFSATLQANEDTFKDLVQPVFEQSCVKCHGAKEKIKGDVDLTKLQSASDLVHQPELLQDMIDVLDFEEMPPEEEEPLEIDTRKELLSYLNSLLETAVATNKDFPATPIRRMNRFQYNNAVQDLFDLKVDVFALPERMMRDHSNYFDLASGVMPDELKAGSRPLGKSQLIDKRLAGVAPFPQDLRAEHGFDNQADHLSLSPLLLESFLQLSRSIVESHDFNKQNCGIWDDFFAEPAPSNGKDVSVTKQKVTSESTLLASPLKQRIQLALDKVNQKTDLYIDYQLDVLDKPLSPAVTKLILQTINVTLKNTMQYAKARKASITFNQDDEMLRGLIVDDGIGLDKTAKANLKSLAKLQTQYEQLNGKLDIFAFPSKGTTVMVQIPTATN